VTGVYTKSDRLQWPGTNSTEVTVTDLNATEASKFYRVKITYP